MYECGAPWLLFMSGNDMFWFELPLSLMVIVTVVLFMIVVNVVTYIVEAVRDDW